MTNAPVVQPPQHFLELIGRLDKELLKVVEQFNTKYRL